MLPSISIVTPSYNQAHYIGETIRSVLSQSHAPLQYIVMDGGSTDGTVQILHQYDNQITWRSEPDRGQAEAINKGLRLATSDIVAYLNSDDVYLSGTLQTVAQFMATHPHIGLVYGHCRVIGPEGEPLGLILGPQPNLSRLIHRAEFIPQPATFWRREVLERIGLLDESLHYALDYDYFIRIAQAFPVALIDQPLAAFRLHSRSKSVSGEDPHWQESLAVSRRYGSGWHSPQYILRVARHRGLYLLPAPVRQWVRRRLNRPQDQVVLETQHRLTAPTQTTRQGKP